MQHAFRLSAILVAAISCSWVQLGNLAIYLHNATPQWNTASREMASKCKNLPSSTLYLKEPNSFYNSYSCTYVENYIYCPRPCGPPTLEIHSVNMILH